MTSEFVLSDDQTITIDQLIDTHYVAIVRLAYSILENEADAEDAAQEIFMKANRNLSSFRGDANVKTWLFAIGINHCRQRMRRKRFKQTVLSVLDRVPAGEKKLYPEQSAIASETRRRLWDALDALKDKHKLPILLSYVHGLSGREIAQVLGISEGTVYSRIHYAKQKLQVTLGTSDIQFETR